jgi:hypothetical protein
MMSQVGGLLLDENYQLSPIDDIPPVEYGGKP